MNKNKLYRTIITSFFLGLYIFIAVPTYYWHTHNHTIINTSLTQKATDTNKQVLINGSDLSEGDCSICSHHYQSYIGYGEHISTNFAQYFNSAISYYSHQYFQIVTLQSTGRAPPVALLL